jgi:biotin carboxylase/acyl carrier protein
MAELPTIPDVDTIAGLIKGLVAYLAGQSPHSIDDATGLETLGIDGPRTVGIVGGIQRCFGVQVPQSEFRTDLRTVGQLSEALGGFVHDALRTPRPLPQRRLASMSREAPSADGLQAEPRSSTPRRVLLVGGATSPELEQAVARRGWRAAMLAYCDVANGGTAPRVGDRGVLDHLEAVDWSRPLDIVQRIVDLYTAGYIDRVVAVDEFGLLPAVLATTQLGIPGPSLRAVHTTRDKFHMRCVLEQAGLDQVRYAVCRDLAEAQAFLERIGGPIILKPVTGTGSEGVSRVESADELAPALQSAAGAVGFTGILCEEYIDGPEVSLEGYCVDGRFVPVALTDKLTDEHFLETGHQQPTAHPQSVFAAAADIAGRAFAALGVENGVTHTEFRISNRGPMLIETHTRMGGDQIHVLTRLTTGVDLADLMVAFGIGEAVEVRPASQGRAAAIRFATSRPGQVNGVRVPAREHENGIHAVLGPPIGRVFTGRSASRERLAHVIATGPTPDVAGKNAESFLAQIHVDYFEQ